MSTLRLASSAATSSSNSNSSSTLESYLQRLSDDTSISLTQKQDCLKTLVVVLKNVIDPKKGGLAVSSKEEEDGNDGGLKYRTLKLENPKLKARLLCSSSDTYVLDLLQDPHLVGMTNSSSGSILVMAAPPSPTIRDIIGLRVLPAIHTLQATMAQQIMKAAAVTEGTANNHHKKAKLFATMTTTENYKQAPTAEKLTEKQQARRLMEHKLQHEKHQEKLYRQRTQAQIKADKLVRETDENWKPAVSAAADKSGTGLQSFRDRHGETDE